MPQANKTGESYEEQIRDMVRLEKEQGLDKARQLTKYQGVTQLTRSQAMEILETIWPDAPATDKVAAAILCSSYGLNPLANHVFLIPFKDKTGRKTWARVWGIKAKRLLASRTGGYSYLDMTPRLMTEAEQIKVWGAVDKANLCFLTWLKDTKTGAEAYGYGKWPANQEPYGTDKGNSKANMASIRSESQAIDRLRPAEMPTGFAITDEQYIEGESRVVDVSTGEITEPETGTEPSATAVEPPTSPTTEPTSVIAPEEAKQPTKPKRDPATLKTITALQKALFEDFKLQPKTQLDELNLKSWSELTLTPAEAYQQIQATR